MSWPRDQGHGAFYLQAMIWTDGAGVPLLAALSRDVLQVCGVSRWLNLG